MLELSHRLGVDDSGSHWPDGSPTHQLLANVHCEWMRRMRESLCCMYLPQIGLEAVFDPHFGSSGRRCKSTCNFVIFSCWQGLRKFKWLVGGSLGDHFLLGPSMISSVLSLEAGRLDQSRECANSSNGLCRSSLEYVSQRVVRIWNSSSQAVEVRAELVLGRRMSSLLVAQFWSCLPEPYCQVFKDGET